MFLVVQFRSIGANELLEEINEIVPEVQGVVAQRTAITCRSFLQAAPVAPRS
jgi:hypothetical protein